MAAPEFSDDPLFQAARAADEAVPSQDTVEEQLLWRLHFDAELQVRLNMRNGLPDDWKYGSLQALVLDIGQPMESQELPADVERGEKKQCYSNAWELWLARPDEFTYVEGFALSATTGLVTNHGWCVDTEGLVVDPTWDTPEDNAYYGFDFSEPYLMQLFKLADETLPVLHSRDATLLKNGLPELDW